jgi:hypothetical protein
MRMGSRVFLAVLIVLLCVSPLRSQAKVDTVEILEWGIYTSEVRDDVEAEGTVQGTWRLVEKVNVIAQTDSIPAKVGTHFGFWFVVKGEPKGEEILITFVNFLPGLKNPKKDEVLYEERYMSIVRIGEPSFKGYSFDFDWETVPGEWTFQIYHEDKELAKKSFVVYK